MSDKSNVMFLAAGALAFAVLAFPAFAGAAQDRTVATTEFSAQNNDPNKKKTAVPQKPATKQGGAAQKPAVRQGGSQPQFKQSGGGNQQFKKSGSTQQFKQGGGQKNFGNQKQGAPKFAVPNSGTPKIARRVFTPKGKNSQSIIAVKIRNAPARGAFRTTIRGRNYSLWRSGYRARYRGGWRTFVGLSALGVLAIGAYEYYPYAYLDAPEEYCEGQTEDGCQMVFDDVPTVEGDSAGQCVAYCPQQ